MAREKYDNYVYSQYDMRASKLSFHLNEKGRAVGIDSMSAKSLGRQTAWFRGYTMSRTDRARANCAAAVADLAGTDTSDVP